MSNTSRRQRPRVSEAYGEDPSPFRKAARPPLLERVVPVSRDLPTYGRAAFRRDALAGVTVAALALPSGMAYAEFAGLSPVAGLYALLLPTVAYVALGSSRQLIVGPEGSTRPWSPRSRRISTAGSAGWGTTVPAMRGAVR